jgi:hypothetical protein
MQLLCALNQQVDSIDNSLQPLSCATCASLCMPHMWRLTRLLCSAACFVVLQTLYESSVAFGMRKALMTEQGKGEMESHIGQMEGGMKDLERQVGQRQRQLAALAIYSSRLVSSFGCNVLYLLWCLCCCTVVWSSHLHFFSWQRSRGHSAALQHSSTPQQYSI